MDGRPLACDGSGVVLYRTHILVRCEDDDLLLLDQDATLALISWYHVKVADRASFEG